MRPWHHNGSSTVAGLDHDTVTHACSEHNRAGCWGAAGKFQIQGAPVPGLKCRRPAITTSVLKLNKTEPHTVRRLTLSSLPGPRHARMSCGTQ